VAIRRNFFIEELAECPALTRLAAKAFLDTDNTMGLLARYGRDVAGALKVWDPTAAANRGRPSSCPALTQISELTLADQTLAQEVGSVAHSRVRP